MTGGSFQTSQGYAKENVWVGLKAGALHPFLSSLSLRFPIWNRSQHTGSHSQG